MQWYKTYLNGFPFPLECKHPFIEVADCLISNPLLLQWLIQLSWLKGLQEEEMHRNQEIIVLLYMGRHLQHLRKGFPWCCCACDGDTRFIGRGTLCSQQNDRWDGGQKSNKGRLHSIMMSRRTRRKSTSAWPKCQTVVGTITQSPSSWMPPQTAKPAPLPLEILYFVCMDHIDEWPCTTL